MCTLSNESQPVASFKVVAESIWRQYGYQTPLHYTLQPPIEFAKID